MALGLPNELAVTDPAVLVRNIVSTVNPRKVHRFAYMPHWESANSAWERACIKAGAGYIDPRWEVQKVIGEIRKTKVLFTEALHGAIVADTLRIPWVPVHTRDHILSSKWVDWCTSVGLTYKPVRVFSVWDLKEKFTLQRRLRHKAKQFAVSLQLNLIHLLVKPVLSDERRIEQLIGELNTRLDTLRKDISIGKYQ
jgi:succinoglycan biosynthesis protein ExoV